MAHAVPMASAQGFVGCAYARLPDNERSATLAHTSMKDFDTTTLTRAIEDNAAEFLLTLGRIGGGEECLDARLSWTIGGSPIDYHNAVVRADLHADEADAAIVESVQRMRARGVPGSWHVGPSMRPADLRKRLTNHGFVHAFDEAGMAADLAVLREDSAPPTTLAVTRVTNASELALWRDTLARGFGAGPHEAEWVATMYDRIGFGDGTPWWHYLGRFHGQPVATASMFFGARVAGIYFVFTIAEARRLGIGAAITLAALRDAKALGYQVGVLCSSNMGESVYRRIGFHKRCRIGIYEWRDA